MRSADDVLAEFHKDLPKREEANEMLVQEVTETEYMRLHRQLDELQNGRAFSEIPLSDPYFEKRDELHRFKHALKG